MRDSNTDSSMHVEAVTTHAQRILDKLGSSADVVARTMDLIHLGHEDGVLASCSNIGSAAGLIYIAGILEKEPVTLAGIGKAAGLNAGTVQRYKTLLATHLKYKLR